MKHTPDTLPPLKIDFGSDAYGYEATFVREKRPDTQELAHVAFMMCKLGIYQNATIENAYPAHVGGTEQHFMLRALAKQYGVELQFPEARKGNEVV